ncbi:MAG TPA: UDP-N-acetylglucosamine--N-acetylmuramyl-(pentapeptide) pyrophosphoryl-undecaprenol N-acetylglucosamine transferase, partial [Pseudomonadaceae bacterium]|nr:UDP-N-acetylglucosamine--N-acetylmuramyl-(pentapeptide) pyrophosphoryl-undecaprenol N-acetylglucosamine transferase [Pseudomonadaceae bacterium]
MSAKVLIMAGGTGGHVFPALTIARELRARGVQVEWLGTHAGLEARVIGETDIPLHFITIGGLRGKSLGKLLAAPFAICRALFQARRLMKQIRPDCVLGMGGFVTGPGGVAAWMQGRPLVLHEQNAIAGLSNQLLYPFARVVMEAFSGAFQRKLQLSRSFLWKRLMAPAKIRVTGNPVRDDILGLVAPEARLAQRQGPLRLLVLGGSLGAVAINDCLPAMLAALPAESRPLVRHQCGSKHVEATVAAYGTAGLPLGAGMDVLPFIEDMAQA